MSAAYCVEIVKDICVESVFCDIPIILRGSYANGGHLLVSESIIEVLNSDIDVRTASIWDCFHENPPQLFLDEPVNEAFDALMDKIFAAHYWCISPEEGRRLLDEAFGELFGISYMTSETEVIRVQWYGKTDNGFAMLPAL